MNKPDPPHVLVVDDAPVVRLYHRHILEAAGYHVTEAVNGLDAMETALRSPVDLCIVDVNMPVMDGYAFLHALRATPALCGIPVVMISTEAGEADRLESLKAGANAYVVKPASRETLCELAAAMLGRSLA